MASNGPFIEDENYNKVESKLYNISINHSVLVVLRDRTIIITPPFHITSPIKSISFPSKHFHFCLTERKEK